jgi:dTDP-glucose pyrophosphorylase
MGTGSCVFKKDILSYLPRTPINPNRGERELPDLIQVAIDEGNRVKSFLVCDKYFNINSEEDLVEANRFFSESSTKDSIDSLQNYASS